MSREAMRLIIEGRVQGVGYRWWAVREATALGLDGWVRNRRDGSVEAYAVGRPAALDALVAWAETGPPAARDDACTVSPAEADAALHDFTQAATA